MIHYDELTRKLAFTRRFTEEEKFISNEPIFFDPIFVYACTHCESVIYAMIEVPLDLDLEIEKYGASKDKHQVIPKYRKIHSLNTDGKRYFVFQEKYHFSQHFQQSEHTQRCPFSLTFGGLQFSFEETIATALQHLQMSKGNSVKEQKAKWRIGLAIDLVKQEKLFAERMFDAIERASWKNVLTAYFLRDLTGTFAPILSLNKYSFPEVSFHKEELLSRACRHKYDLNGLCWKLRSSKEWFDLQKKTQEELKDAVV